MHPGGAVGEVVDVGDALQLFGLHQLLDLLDHFLRTHEIGQLRDDDALTARRDVLDPGGGARLERTPPAFIRLPYAVQPHDRAAGGQVGAGDEAHQVIEGGPRVGDQVSCGADDFDEIVRRHVGGHSDRNPRGAVDQQVGIGRWQHVGLQELVVIVRDEVDRLLVQGRGHQQGRGGHPGLGVARGGRPVVEGAEVAVAVHQGEPHAERLGHPDHRFVDRKVSVRVVLTHDLTDHAGALHVRSIGA